MRRYDFRLGAVLRIRRIQEDVARAAFLGAGAELDAASRALEASFGRYSTLPEAAAAPARAWLLQRSAASRTAATVVAAGSDRELARVQHEHRRHELEHARRRVAALERLDDRRRHEHAVAARRAEDAEVDDLVVARHGRRP